MCRRRCPAAFPVFVLLFTCAALAWSAADPTADAKAGAVLYRDKGCPRCHGADIRSDKAWPPERITKQITDGGQKMPPFGDSLTDQEIAQLVAFLRAKDRPTPPAPPPSN